MKLRTWVKAARLKFLPQGILPVVLGTLVAYGNVSVFDPAIFLLAFVGAALVQVGLTVLNDALDYRAGTDRSATDEKNPYSGGSGVFVDGDLTVREALKGVAAMYVVAMSIGFYLTWLRGMELLAIGLLGVAISVTYSAPPFRFAYRGLGELEMLIGYGPVITAGSYFVQTGAVSVESVLVGLVPGGLMVLMIILNEVPDREEDLAAGKMNLVARVGRRRGVELFGVLAALLYAGVAVAALAGIFPVAALAALLTSPLAAGAYLGARRKVRGPEFDPRGFGEANRLMVLNYSGTMVLMCLSYLA